MDTLPSDLLMKFQMKMFKNVNLETPKEDFDFNQDTIEPMKGIEARGGIDLKRIKFLNGKNK